MSREREQAMITGAGAAMLYVSDQEESVRSYRDILGFTVVTDQEIGPGMRWV